MVETIYIGDFASPGLKTDRTAFNIDNDSFPYLFNFYVWRARVKRKRGTRYLGQLTRKLSAVSLGNISSAGAGTITLNIFSALGVSASQPGANIVPGTVANPIVITITNGSVPFVQTLTDTTGTGVLTVATVSGTGTITSATINYGTGIVSIVVSGVTSSSAVTITFSYYPGLPVMGESDVVLTASTQNFPNLLAFDTLYSYQCNQAAGNATFWNVNYYKSSGVPFVWSGQDYQQFYTINYPSTNPTQAGCLWATNNVPGFNFKSLTNTLVGDTLSVVQTSATSVTVGLTAHGLVNNDYVFFNEVVGTIAIGSNTTQNQNINGQSGLVTVINANSFTATFTNSNFQGGATGTGGIAQYLTNTISGQDGIKWYDGDPTDVNHVPLANPPLGWVNFAPPLTASEVSIGGTPVGKYYLVGALAISAFKDRLIFFSPWIQTSSGLPIQLIDTALWSWNGTPYYTIPVPKNQTAVFNAYFVDQTGLGGYLSSSTSQPIYTISNNEDVILLGFGGSGRKTRFVYTGNDLDPFLFFNINSELPSTATFSAITLDKGMIDIGTYGIAMTDQQSSQRIDLDIPDYIFNIQYLNNGIQRTNAIRDYFREWIYFTYPLNTSQWKFPSNSLLFNYRDNTWGFLYENYTTHGYYRAYMKKTWLTTGYKSWNDWREPWNSGINSPLNTQVIAGNPQGYVLIQSEGTSEAQSGTVNAVGADAYQNVLVTSYNHCVNYEIPDLQVPEYLYFTGGINTPYLNGVIGKVLTTPSANTFTVDIQFPVTATITNITQAVLAVVTAPNNYVIGQQVTISGVVGMTQLNGNTYTVTAANALTFTLNVNSTAFTAYVSGGIATPLAYLGLAQYARLSTPFLQTKQFNPYWDEGRQVRLGSQKYLFDKTTDSEVTQQIYLSQDNENPWNDPVNNPPPNSLEYSQVLYTCPESTNLGLTPSNINLQSPIASSQNQIWHRVSTSLQGDSVQIGITLNDTQMRNYEDATAEITLHAMQLNVDRGPYLA
jgi:hypothetical protein